MLLIAAVVVVVLAGPSWWSVTLVALAAVFEAGQLVLGLRYARRRRERAILGRTGRMRADGTVDVAGELWPAIGATPGDSVRVVGVEGRALRVERRQPG